MGEGTAWKDTQPKLGETLREEIKRLKAGVIARQDVFFGEKRKLDKLDTLLGGKAVTLDS